MHQDNSTKYCEFHVISITIGRIFPLCAIQCPYWLMGAICLYIHIMYNVYIQIRHTTIEMNQLIWSLSHWWLKNTQHLLWRQPTKSRFPEDITPLNHRGFACEDINWVNRSNCQPWATPENGWFGVDLWGLSHDVFFDGLGCVLCFCVGLVWGGWLGCFWSACNHFSWEN